jgi:uncharacterized protein (TIGR02145 family)
MNFFKFDKMTKMKFILSILLLINSYISFSQSKKKQIEALTFRADSLIKIVNAERKLNIENSLKILELTTKVDEQDSKILKMISDILDLTSELRESKTESIKKQQEIDRMILQINSIESQKNQIKSVKIGSQIWMAENLNVSTFRNGDPIKEARSAEDWESACKNKIPAWCYYNNDQKNGNIYGKLYNVYAVNDPRGLAPKGWHVPSVNEWETLERFLRNSETGKKMKSENGWSNWDDDLTCSNCENWNLELRNKKKCFVCNDTRSNGKKTLSGNGNNSSGFSALPGGFRYNQDFMHLGNHGYWWSAEIYSDYFSLYNDDEYLFRNSSFDFPLGTTGGLSLRCVKD